MVQEWCVIKAKPATKKLVLPFHLEHCMANFVVAEYMVGCGKCHYVFEFLLTHEYICILLHMQLQVRL